jgi:precorrin-4/cobalt-precorrin-4 C11-methyltransferase
MKYPVMFVGAGPGDPELITVKGSRLLREAECIVYAGSLVPESLLADRKPGAEVHNSAGLDLEATHRLLRDGYEKGRRVVRLHTGDPSLYGAIQEQMDLLDRDGIPYEVVPGVSAVFAAAAGLRQELTLPDMSQTLILTRMAGRTPVPESESIESLASHRATLVIYLSVNRIEEVVSRISAAYPPETSVVVAYRVGWPDQEFVHGTLGNIAQKVEKSGIKRQAIIMIGEVFGVRDRDLKTRSRLYDQTFSHGFRSGRKDP